MIWRVTTSCAREVLDVVDGRGAFEEHGPHYSRRRRDSRKITTVGKEIVLITECGRAVWAVLLGKPPRGNGGEPLFRNTVFRSLGAGLASELIIEAHRATFQQWTKRYGFWPGAPLRTEIDTRYVRSKNPGYSYRVAGWTRIEGPPSAAARRPYMRYFVAPSLFIN